MSPMILFYYVPDPPLFILLCRSFFIALLMLALSAPDAAAVTNFPVSA